MDDAWWVRVYIDEQRERGWSGMMMMILESKRTMEGLGGGINKTMGQRGVWTVGIVFHSEL